MIIILLIVIIASIIFIIGDAKKRNMSAAWSLWGLFGLLGIVIYLISRKPITNQEVVKNTITNGNYSQFQNQQVTIPDTCPQCKNPNTKLIRLCEWCGSQIC